MRHFLIILLSLWLPATGQAQVLFPTSPALEPKIDFWEKIFTKYQSHQLVMHDKLEPRLIIGTIDLPAFGSADGRSPESVDTLARETKRYEAAIASFAAKGPAARKLSPLHARIWKVYKQNKAARRRLLLGEVTLRGQGGLADTFRNAYATSALYLPRMEKIFRQHGLPPELTRLVYVESMFNIKARSKVGASGLWQLMPATARAYITVNRQRDQRNSPFHATEAAARVLKSNYQALGTWPLAITAYNHGQGGMRRAVKQTGSRDLNKVIAQYRSPSFGFASQNFYAEFVAAKRSHRKLQLAQKKRSPPKASPNRQQMAVEREAAR